jgi:hypothetical protein
MRATQARIFFLFINQFKAVFAAFDNTLGAELAYLRGKSASVDLKVICQFLTVKGDIKDVASRFFRLKGKI